MMKIWVDADACPKVIRETIVRAAERTGVECTFIANHVVPVPKRNNIHSVQVPSGFDIADNEIVKRTEAGDLVITSDIPLADEVIAKGTSRRKAEQAAAEQILALIEQASNKRKS